jgi:LysM repeat protein
MYGGVLLAGGPESPAAPVLGTIGAGAGAALGFEATLKGFDALLGYSADNGIEIAQYIKDAKESAPGYYQVGMLLPMAPAAVGSIKGVISAGRTTAQMENKLGGAKVIAGQLGLGALGGASFSGAAQAINREFDPKRLAFDTFLGTMFAGKGLRGTSAEYGKQKWDVLVEKMKDGTATADERSDLNAILGAQWSGRVSEHFKNRVKGGTETIYGEIPVTEEQAQAAIERVSKGKGTPKDYTILTDLLPKIEKTDGVASARVLGINQGDVRAYSDVTLEGFSEGGPRLGGTSPIPNAPLTSRALENSTLTQEVEQAIKPEVKPEEPFAGIDEDLDLSDLLPKPKTNEQETPASQEETKTPAPAEGEQAGPSYGQQVLGRIAGSPEQSQEASPYDKDEPELSAASVADELNFNRPGRPAKVVTQIKEQPKQEDEKPLMDLPVVNPSGVITTGQPEEKKDQQVDLNFKRKGAPSKYKTVFPENKLAKQLELDFSSAVGASEVPEDPAEKRAVDYASEFYLQSLRPTLRSEGRPFANDSEVFPQDLSMAEFMDKVIPALKDAELKIPDTEQGQLAFVRAVKRQIRLSNRPPLPKAEVEVEQEEEETNLPTTTVSALQDLNARLARLEQNKPAPVKRLARVKQPGSRVTGEIKLNEESPEYYDNISKLPEAPGEAQLLTQAENDFKRKAANYRQNHPEYSVDESRLANAARMRYWRQLRVKHDRLKNRTKTLGEGEAEEIFKANVVPSLSKNRIWGSVTADYARKFGRRMGGKVGLEASMSLQTKVGDDDGSTLEDYVPDNTAKPLEEAEVRRDISKNARNAYFASLGNDFAKRYLLGAALMEGSKKNSSPKDLAKNTTKLSEIAGVLTQNGIATSTGELQKILPKLIDEFAAYVADKVDADMTKYRMNGELPVIVEGPEKSFQVLSRQSSKPQLSAYDKDTQAVARDLLSELEESGMLSPVEVANIQDDLDMSPRSGAALKAIRDMQAMLSAKQPGRGLTEPTVKIISGQNPVNVPDKVPSIYNLLPHQRKGANLVVMAYENGRKAAFVADDPGLGKTRTGLAAARTIADKIAKAKDPEAIGKVIVITESNELIDASMGGLKSQLAAANITSRRTYFYTLDAYSKGSIPDIETADVIIFDEAQNLKNSSTARSKLSKQTNAFKIFLSATPTDRIGGIRYFLPDILGKSQATVDTMIEKSRNPEQTIANLLESAATVGAYVRRVADSNKPQVSTVSLEAGDEIAGQIQEIENYYRKQIEQLKGDTAAPVSKADQLKSLELTAMLKFKTEAWAEISKAPAVFELAMQDLQAGRQVVIFGELVRSVAFPELGLGEVKSMLETLNEMFTAAGYNPAVLYGDGGNQMTTDVNDFQTGLKKVALGTPAKAASGLNLDDQTGTAPRSLILATPNEAADRHEQMLYRVGHRVSSRSVPIIRQLVAEDINSDKERLSRQEAKQGVLTASQGISPETQSGQQDLPFDGGKRVDRNSMSGMEEEEEVGSIAVDLDEGLNREATLPLSGMKIDSRYSSLLDYEQEAVRDVAGTLQSMGFKDVKIIFGRRGKKVVWTEWGDTDHNTIYMNPTKFANSQYRVASEFRNKVAKAGEGYLQAIVSEEMLHNSLFSLIRAVSANMFKDNIQNGDMTAQEAYQHAMNHILAKVLEEMSPESKAMIQAKYGTELTPKQMAIEYLRFIHQKAGMGYTTEDFTRPDDDSQTTLKTLLKGAPKDGFIAYWFKMMRQALFDMLEKMGVTVKDMPAIGKVLDAVDTVLHSLQVNGANAPPEKSESVKSLIRFLSGEEEARVTLQSPGMPRVSSEKLDIEPLKREIIRSQSLKLPTGQEVFGDAGTVRDHLSNEYKYRYGWVNLNQVQASHLGPKEFFAKNPKYTGLNTRDYSKDKAEQRKVNDLSASKFNAGKLVEVSSSPNGGLPILIWDKATGQYMVAGGNGREQIRATAWVKEANKNDTLENAKNLTRELGSTAPADYAEGNKMLYRVMDETVDTSTEAGRARLNYLIKAFNTEGGMLSGALSMAEQDVDTIVKTPKYVRLLRDMALRGSVETGEAKTFVNNLIESNAVPRLERNLLVTDSDVSSAKDYTKYLILRTYLAPMERFTSIAGTIPESEMARAILELGEQQSGYFLKLAQVSASAEVLKEGEAKTYKGFVSRLANEMLTQKFKKGSVLHAIESLAEGEFDMLREGGGVGAYPEITAQPDIQKAINQMWKTLAATRKNRDGRMQFGATTNEAFDTYLESIANAFREKVDVGPMDDLLSTGETPLDLGVERARFLLRQDGGYSASSEIEGEDPMFEGYDRSDFDLEDPKRLYKLKDEVAEDPFPEQAVKEDEPVTANKEVFEESIRPAELDEPGYKSRALYNQLLSAFERAGMARMFKLRKLIENMAMDETWAKEVIEKANGEYELKEFFTKAYGLMEPTHAPAELEDPLIARLVFPIVRATQVTKSPSRVLNAEDEAIERLVEAQERATQLRKFLSAINVQSNPEFREMAEKAEAGYLKFLKTCVRNNLFDDPDAVWDVTKREWLNPKAKIKSAKPLKPLDGFYRLHLAALLEQIEKDSRVAYRKTPSVATRGRQIAELKVKAIENAAESKKAWQDSVLAMSSRDEFGIDLKAFQKASDEEQVAKDRYFRDQVLVEHYTRAVDNITRLDLVQNIQALESGNGEKLTKKQVSNLPDAIRSELRRRGVDIEQPMVTKNITWVFPKGFIGLNNQEPVSIKAKAIIQANAGQGFKGMLIGFEKDGGETTDYRTPVFSDGRLVSNFYSELAAASYYNNKGSAVITRNQGGEYPSIRLVLPVSPDLEAVRRVKPMTDEEAQKKSAPKVMPGMRILNGSMRNEAAVNERGERSWEFQLNPGAPDIPASSVGVTPTKIWKGKTYGGAKSGAITTTNSRARKVYVRARTADEAVTKAIQLMGEGSDLFYKGKWYGKNIATRTVKVEPKNEEEADTIISTDELDVRKAIRAGRYDKLQQAIERGIAKDEDFEFVAKREGEAYLSEMFSKGAKIDDPEVVSVAIRFGFASFRGGKVLTYKLKEIQKTAVARNTPKSMSAFSKGNKMSATGPSRNVSENFLFGGKKQGIEQPAQETTFTVPGVQYRKSDEVLADLASQNGVTVDALKQANSLVLGKLTPGTQLLIPGTTRSVEVPAFAVAPEKLTALDIAKKFGITKAELLSHNRLPADYEPKPEDELRIPGAMRVDNLQELAFKIIKERAHVTYPQMVYIDRAPQGVRLVDKEGNAVGSSVPDPEEFDPDRYAGMDQGMESISAPVFKAIEVFNRAGNASCLAPAEATTQLLEEAVARSKKGSVLNEESKKKQTRVTIDQANYKIVIEDEGEGLTQQELEDKVFGEFYEEGNTKRTAFGDILATSRVEVMTIREGTAMWIRTSPETMLTERIENRPSILRDSTYGDLTGKNNGTRIEIALDNSVRLPGFGSKILDYYMPTTLDVDTVKVPEEQAVYVQVKGRTAEAKYKIGKESAEQGQFAFLQQGSETRVQPEMTRNGLVKLSGKRRVGEYRISINGMPISTTARTIDEARSQLAAKLILTVGGGQYNYNGEVFRKNQIGLLTWVLKKNNVAVERVRTFNEEEASGASTPAEGERREFRAKGLKGAREREGMAKSQGFARQMANDERLSQEVNNISNLSTLKYQVRTQPLRAEEMLGLINQNGGAEVVARLLLSPDVEVNDSDLSALRDGSSMQFDNMVVLNQLLMQQLENVAKENPERANEIYALEFELAKKQADLGTTLAQGLAAFGAYSRIGAAGWLWFADNAKRNERLRQVGLFAKDIEAGAIAGDEAVNKSLEKVLGQGEIEKIGQLINESANNAIWAQLALKARRVAEMSAQWQKVSTNTLSDILEQQVKTTREMLELLKRVPDSAEKRSQAASLISQGTAALLQKGSASPAEAAKELGVTKEDVLVNLESAQDMVDDAKQAVTDEIQNHLSKRYGNTKMVDEEDTSVGASSLKPNQEISRTSAVIIENVLSGFIENFQKAMDAKDPNGKLPKETAVGVIRRILRERVQLQAGNQLKLTRSKMSAEQRKLLSIRRFRDAMTFWESLQQAVQEVYDTLGDTVDNSSFEQIVEAMQLAMDEPFTKSDVKAFMTLPAFNFKDFIFSNRYKLTANKAGVLAELAQELRVSGVTVDEKVLSRVLDKISEEMDKVVEDEFNKSLGRLFGKRDNKAISAIKARAPGILKAALAGHLSDSVVFEYIAEKLKLENKSWEPSQETKDKIRAIAQEIANDPDGLGSRRAMTKTIELLDTIKKDAGITIAQAFMGQFYTNILQGVKTITINILSPIGSLMTASTALGRRAVKDKNFSATRVALQAVPRALNTALTEMMDLLGTGDMAGKIIDPTKSMVNRVSGKPIPELLADTDLKINANSGFGKLLAKGAELWFGWNQKGIWPKIPVSKSVWDGAYKLVSKSSQAVGLGKVKGSPYPEKVPVIQVSPTGVGVLISRLFNALDLGSTTFYSEVFAALAASDVSKELIEQGREVASPSQLLSTDLGNLLRLGRKIAGRDERLPSGANSPDIVREFADQAKQERVERLKPGTLAFRQQLSLSARRNRGVSNPYWNRVWNKSSKAEMATMSRMIEQINDEALFLGSWLAFTNKPTGMTGKLAKALEGWSNEHMIGKIIQPFYSIVTNVYQVWLTWMGTGILKAGQESVQVFGEGRKRKPEDMRSAELGSGIAGLGILMAGLAMIVGRIIGDDKDKKERFFDFSGKGPEDLGLRQALINSGEWQPDSIKIGNLWLKNPNWLPTYLLFKTLGYMSDYAKYDKPSKARTGELASQLAIAGLKSAIYGVSDVPFLSGAKTMADLFSLDRASWNVKAVKFLMRMGGSMAFGNLYRELDRNLFPVRNQQPTSVSLQSALVMATGNVPFLRNVNKPQTNVLGEPMSWNGKGEPSSNPLQRAGETFFNYGDMIMTYRDKPDQLWVELARKRTWISLPDVNVRVKGIVLNEDQRDEWVMERAKVLKETVRDPKWVNDLPNRDTGDVQNEIDRLTTRANRSADRLILDKYPEIWDKGIEYKREKREMGRNNVE